MKLKSLVAEASKNATTAAETLQAKARKLLVKDSLSLIELSDALNCSPKTTKSILSNLRLEGYNVQIHNGEASLSAEVPAAPPLVVKSKNFFDGRWHKLGVLGDTHLASKYARLDVLRSIYEIYEREGIKTVLHTGNIVEGEARFNRHELLTRSGFEPQVEYLVNEYPERKGIETWFITGEDHEGWWISREGINVGARMQDVAEKKGRRDLRWIGHLERDLHFQAKNGAAWAKVMHPGGGTAYAVSYTTQKIVEALQGGEKPRMLFVGHYHKFEHGYPREVHTVQTGCVQDQTAFMRRNKIQAHVGGLIIRFHQADTGEINRFTCEWMPYYGRGFYEKHDRYDTW